MESVLLTETEGQALVQFARETIHAALTPDTISTPVAPISSPRLEAPGASFVTLHTREGALRGCIGSLTARRPLIEDVQANALAAAFEDPRFPPLKPAELPDIVVEVSVLTPAQPLDYETPAELIEKLRPNVDGVLLQRGWHRATFLPQVWEQLSRPEDFLSHLCYKAGLSGLAWKEGDLEVSTYQVQKFEEARHPS